MSARMRAEPLERRREMVPPHLPSEVVRAHMVAVETWPEILVGLSVDRREDG